jgi:general secretion pathway protein H
MPMSATGRNEEEAIWSDATAGVTLIEVLAVVFLLAMVAGLATVNLGRFDERATASQLAIATAVEARSVRSRAIRMGQDQVLVIDVDRRRIAGVSSTTPVVVAAMIDLDVEVSAIERGARNVAGIRFFANGQSTGGTIRFGSKGKAYEVRVNWFTGRVGVSPVG